MSIGTLGPKIPSKTKLFFSGTQMQIEEAQRLIQEKAGVAPPPPSNQTNPSMHQYGDVSAISNLFSLVQLLRDLQHHWVLPEHR